MINLYFFRSSLKSNGVIVVKENVTTSEVSDVDEQDSGKTRPLTDFRRIFHQAGLRCYHTMRQSNFPKFLYNVYLFALTPAREVSENDSTSGDGSETSRDLLEIRKLSVDEEES